jgi:hypothetical protein
VERSCPKNFVDKDEGGGGVGGCVCVGFLFILHPQPHPHTLNDSSQYKKLLVTIFVYVNDESKGSSDSSIEPKSIRIIS